MTTTLQRIDELLIEEATGGLSASEQAELETMLAEHPGVDRHAYERAAAAVLLAALAEPTEAMPAAVRARLVRAAEQV